MEYLSWPGKSDDEHELSAAFHMLDVAACAERLLPLHEPLASAAPPLQQAALMLVALHDLGKISRAFRDQIKEREPPPQGCRHWELTDHLLLTLDETLERLLRGKRAPRFALYAAVAGHHGGPPDRGDRHLARKRKRAVGGEALEAARIFVEDLAALFPEASLEGVCDETALRLSWPLAGLTVLADWVGSNTQWFPLDTPTGLLADHLATARGRATHALAEAGLGRSRMAEGTDAATIVNVSALRPLQEAAASVDLPEGPCLTLLEDATGAGKTEAALILAQRMIRADKGRGIFFALPTMATADAMFERLRPVLGRMFAGRPSLALAHGRRHLSPAFAEVKGSDGGVASDAGCAEWLADDRRRSLLAEIGVGTIDQALMAILPTRFSTLRLLAVTNRVLVVDEAHAYDPYMEGQLKTLLRFQAMLGGSAIVMTATLPRGMRADLAQAFQRGLGVPPEPINDRSYPSFTVVSQGTTTRAVDPVPETVRHVQVNRLPTKEAAIEVLVESARQKAACVWVRNAVDDAIEGVRALRERGIEADLLHARFAMCDRLEIERRMLEHFGKHGSGREGRVLVATQVVEASLDLDFDVMVSDLAPVGALLQRAGRLWRHMDLRPAGRRPVNRPTLHVLSPDPSSVTDQRWVHQALDAGAYVYRQDDQWRTAHVLFAKGGFDAPEGLRDLIEAVHGDDQPELPGSLERVGLESEGEMSAEAAMAMQNVVSPIEGYSQERTQRVFEDRRYPTRLGREQVTLILARRGPEGLMPWAEDESAVRAEALSEVQISRARYTRLAEKPSVDAADLEHLTAGWPRWRLQLLESGAYVVAVVKEGGAITDELHYDGKHGLWIDRADARKAGC